MKTKNRSAEKVFLVGILGTGMTSLAKFLLDEQANVSGSDIRELDKFQYLYSYKDKFSFFNRHSDENIQAVMPDEIIYSKAINLDNSELRFARENSIRILSRPMKLAELSSSRKLVLITGTHGKSTITAVSSYIAMKAERPISFMIGAIPHGFPPAMSYPKSPHLILEGDESNREILALSPEVLLISSLEWDHPESYTKEEIYSLFFELVSKKSIKTLIFNRSYRQLSEIVEKAGSHIENIISYSATQKADIMLEKRLNTSDFIISQPSGQAGVKSRLFGLKNAENIIGSYALMRSLGLDQEHILESIGSFSGISKRLEFIGRYNNLSIYVDYSHHPTELKGALSALREKHEGRKLILAFEPHMPSRLKFLFDDFMDAFAFADKLVLTEVFRARMDPNESFSILSSIDEIRKHFPGVVFLEAYESIISYIRNNMEREGILLISSAGPLGDFVKRSFCNES